MKLNKLKNKKGFTLIETLISLALFSVVLVISGGVIVSVIDINKKNQAIASVVDNLNYSIDSFVRDVKTGYLYKCDYTGEYTVAALKALVEKKDEGCVTSLTLVSTISGEDVVVKYELKKPADKNSYIEKTVYKADTNPASYSITDKNNVNIENLYIRVKNPSALDCDSTVSSCDYGQPSVFLSIKGVAGNKDVDASKFFLQTFISQRLINLTDFKD